MNNKITHKLYYGSKEFVMYVDVYPSNKNSGIKCISSYINNLIHRLGYVRTKVLMRKYDVFMVIDRV